MANWGDDYSLLIHSIEGHISEHMAASPTTNPSIPSSQSTSAYKKRRLSSEISTYTAHSDEDENGSFSDRISSYQNADVMKMAAELDETRLLNEQLHEKYNGIADEFSKYKGKAVKQLQFMVAENDQLKKETAAQSDRYYDEKKKWQSSLRGIESELSRLNRRGNNEAISPASIPTSSTRLGTVSDARLSGIEMNVAMKSNEVKVLSAANAELDERCSKLQQELMLAKLKIGEQAQADDDVFESRDYRKRCADLETNLRQKSRDYDRLEGKMQNQSLLEEELATANMKLKIAQENNDKSVVIASLYHSLLDEKEEWSTLFQGITIENDNLPHQKTIPELKVAGRSSQNINPAAILRSLGALQKRYVLLLKSQSEFEESRLEIFRKQEMTEGDLIVLKNEKNDALFQLERSASRLRLAQRQAKLYEGEVTSLRALLSSFDVEFGMGLPTNSTLFHMKDKIISGLQEELDTVRKESKSICEHAESLELKLLAEEASVNVALGEGTCVGDSDKNLERAYVLREEALKEELLALQSFSGVDYVPGKTKVLHLIDNPSKQLKGPSSSDVSSLPRDIIKRLQKELKNMHRRGGNQDGDSFNDSKGDISVPTEGIVTSSSTVNAADSNKMNQRLKEMFKERITSFRESVYLLTGYKVDLYAADTPGGHSRLRLRSMYSDDPEDSLLFRMQGDSLELIETPFAAKLDPQLFTYLTTCNSVPAFLSNVTMELFDSQTFLG